MKTSEPTTTDGATDTLIAALHDLWLQVSAYVMHEPIAQLGVIGLVCVVVGGWLREAVPMAGGLLRLIGNLAVMAAVAMGVLRVAGGQLAIDAPGMPLSPKKQDEQVVTGRETRVPLSPDSHFWVRARVNGVPVRFLIDTGATLTTLSPESAEAAHITPRGWGQEVAMQTANGTTKADLASLGELRVGNIVAHDLDAAVAPGLGGTNVLGMNFMRRLASWRVVDNVMILTPHHPIAAPTSKPKGDEE